jgi:hypothetical protein
LRRPERKNKIEAGNEMLIRRWDAPRENIMKNQKERACLSSSQGPL